MLEIYATAIGKVLAVGLVIGAGLPAIFALGIRSLAAGGQATTARDHALGRLGAGICFAVVLGAIVAGVALIVASGFGFDVGFDGLAPVLTRKGH